MLPLYGFLEGDTIGLLIFAYESETVGELARKLQKSASVRVAPRGGVRVVYGGRVLDPALEVGQAGFQALTRFDVVGGDR
jgi:hypothetical protein